MLDGEIEDGVGGRTTVRGGDEGGPPGREIEHEDVGREDEVGRRTVCCCVVTILKDLFVISTNTKDRQLCPNGGHLDNLLKPSSDF